MKTALFLLAVLAASAYAGVVPSKSTRKLADVEFLTRQKNVLDLLLGVGYGHWFNSEYDDFDLVKHASLYEDPHVVKEFSEEYRHGFLPQDQEFSLHCQRSRRQAIKLFNLFYFAKDFDTFYKTACWARKHINPVQFAYALYIAVYHRPDCHSLTLPPIYEVFPSVFVHSEIMHKFEDAKMEGIHKLKMYSNGTGYEDNWHRYMFGGVVLGPYDTPFNHLEDKLSYFREDVGFNDYVAQMALLYPSWMDEAKYTKVRYFRRGELFYYILQQLYARYSLERMSNHLPKTEMLMWDQPIKAGYNPRTLTSNGRPLLPRADYMIPKEFNPHGVWKVEAIERRILDAIDAGVIYSSNNRTYYRFVDEDGTDIWGKVMFGTPEVKGQRGYGAYFQQSLEALGFMTRIGNDDELTPSTMSSMLTVSRDPAFYQFLHRFINIIQRHKDFLPCYTKKEMSFSGVKLESFDVSKLVTYFDYFDYSVTNGFPIPAGKTYKDYEYTVRQRRINNKPFHYKIVISSDESVDAMIRVFIGPKYDTEERPLTLEQTRMGFVELDRFQVKLAGGENVIERNSKESTGFVDDQESYSTLYKRVESCIATKEPFYVTDSFHCGLPDRFMLPKGSGAGIPYQMFAIVSPFENKAAPMAHERHFDNFVHCGGSKLYDGRAYGFPFDRRIDYKDVFHQANMIFKEVKVFHTDEASINRPDFVH